MTAMILAAGRGERMRPLTDKIPKPLIEVSGKALIVWHIEKLASLGFRDIIINIAHLGYMIPEFLGDGLEWGVNIKYSDEQKEGALESAGGIANALKLINSDTFLVVNGDVLCDYEFDKSFELVDDLAHLILVENPKHNPNGDFGIKESRATNDGDEKYTFSGIGYYKKELFGDLELKKAPLAPLLRSQIDKKRVGASLHLGKWHDVGTIERLREAETTSV